MHIAYRRLLPGRLRRWLRSLVVECATHNCRGFHLSHPILRRLPGIFLNQLWYCSPACVRQALQQRIEAQQRTAVTDLRQPPRMPFRLVLLAGGRITEEQLAEARCVLGFGQREGASKQDLGDALVKLSYASEDEVAGARAKEAGYPFYGGEVHVLAPRYQIPLTLMRRCHAAPVHHNPVSGRLLVGFVYRVDRSLLQAIEQVMACRAEACIISGPGWSQRVSRGPAHEEVVREASSQSRSVDLIVEQAMGRHADSIAMGRTGTTLWARLEGGSRAADLVIDVAIDLADGLVSEDPAGNASTIEEAGRLPVLTGSVGASPGQRADDPGLGSSQSPRQPSRHMRLRTASSQFRN